MILPPDLRAVPRDLTNLAISQILPLLGYLDVRGFCECALHHRLVDISKRMDQNTHIQVRQRYAELACETHDVQELLQAMCAAVVEHDEQSKARVAAVSRTFSPVDESAVTNVLGYSSARLVAAAVTVTLDDTRVLDDLDGRPVWAKFNATPWWPGRVVPLCLAPANVLALRQEQGRLISKVKSKAKTKAQRGAQSRGRGGGGRGRGHERKDGMDGNQRVKHEASTETSEAGIDLSAGTCDTDCLIRYYDSNEYAWVNASRITDFWSCYDLHTKQQVVSVCLKYDALPDPQRPLGAPQGKHTSSKSFRRAVRHARLARYNRLCSHSHTSIYQITIAAVQRLQDIMEAVSGMRL